MDTTCGIFLYNLNTNRLLLCHATRSRDVWSIPKGLPDEGEEPFDAAMRELYEETNINASDFTLVKKFDLPVQRYKKQKKQLKAYLLVVRLNEDEVVLKCHTLVNNSFPEIDRYKWVTLDELEQMAHETQKALVPEITSHLQSLL